MVVVLLLLWSMDQSVAAAAMEWSELLLVRLTNLCDTPTPAPEAEAEADMEAAVSRNVTTICHGWVV